MAKIWVVEDDTKISLLIGMTLGKAGHEARRFEDAATLDEALLKEEELPDLLLLDLMLRLKNGYQILREWKERERTTKIPVIILSARSAEQDKVYGLELGAEDYITKPFGIRELQARIQTALRRLPPKDHLLKKGTILMDTRAKTVTVEGRCVELSPLEYELLLYLIRHSDVAVDRRTLLREVWGYASEDDPSRTVDAHIKTLRTKLGDKGLIRTIRGTGYQLSSEVEG